MTVHATTGAVSTATSLPLNAGLGTANTKSGWVQLFASAPKSSVLVIRPHMNSTSYTWALDIGFGAPGSEQVVIPNWIVNPLGNATQGREIPLLVPEGTRVSFRSQPSGASQRLYCNVILIEDGRYAKGAPPTSYAAYNVTVNGSTTAITNYVESGGTANTKGSVVELVSSVPAGASLLILGSDIGGTGANNYTLLDIVYSSDGGATWQAIIENINYAPFTATNTNPQTSAIPLIGMTGYKIGLRSQSSVVGSDSNRRKFFPLYIGLGASEGADGVIIQESTDMGYIVKNTPTASLRTVRGRLRAENGKDRYAGSTTGLKLKWKINGTGAEQTSDNDIVMIDSESATFTCELTQAESDVPAISDTLDMYIAPSPGNHNGAEITVKVFEKDISGDGTSALAAAVVAAEKDALDGLLAGPMEVEIDGQVYDVTRDPTDKYITSMSKQP